MEKKKYHKKMLRFTQEITPKNWNVFLDHNKYSYKPRTLNIFLWVLANCYDWDDEEEEFCGRVGPMEFSKVSFWKNWSNLNINRKVQRSLKKYGDGIIGRSEIQIFDDYLGEQELIHELAHIAVQRLGAWQQKAYKSNIMIVTPNNEDIHGPLFQRAYRRMIIRAEKVLGKKNRDIKTAWVELELYESGKM